MQNENSRLDGSHSPFCILTSSFCIHPQIAELWNCGRRGTFSLALPLRIMDALDWNQ